MTVLSYTNAFPGIAFSQHGSGQTATVQNFIFPGAVQPGPRSATVLSYTKAFPALPFSQHLSGQTATVQNFMYPGAVQPTPVPPIPGADISQQGAFVLA